MNIRPIDIANKLEISTSALRHYEDWGIIPPVERGPNGYRLYTELHVAYFECLRAMSLGFGMDTTKAVLKKLLKKEVDEAWWMVNAAQAELHKERLKAEKTIQILDTKELDHLDTRGKKTLDDDRGDRQRNDDPRFGHSPLGEARPD